MLARPAAKAKTKTAGSSPKRPVRPQPPAAAPRSMADPMRQPYQLQQNITSRAATLSGAIQPKLTIGQVDNPLEREADRVAGEVMRMRGPDLSISAGLPQITRKREQEFQKEAPGSQVAGSEAPGIVQQVL